MAKKRTPEQEAISRANRKRERKAFCSRRMAWARGDWPVKWGFFTNWRGFTISFGATVVTSAGEVAPNPVFTITLDWHPFGFSIFWRDKRLVWIGDWEWKKGL